MSSASTVTYTSVYTDSEPGRVFCGADEELSDGGSPRVIVYGYDGLLMQPVAPPSPDYVPGPEHPPSPDYVPGPEHPPSPAEPLPADASPVALSLGYVADSDPEEDPDEDPEEDHADYPADGGDDDDEPSDDDDVDHVPILLRRQCPISIDPTASYAFSIRGGDPMRLLAFTPPPPYTTHSLAHHPLQRNVLLGFRVHGRLEALITITHHLYLSITTITTFYSLSLHLPTTCTHIINQSLPSPLPPLPALLFIPPPVDRREDTPEAELPPCKRLRLTALTLRYEVGESLTTVPRSARGYGIDYGFIGTLDAETRCQRAEEVGYRIRDVWVDLAEAVEEVALTTLEGVNARVTELAAV
ncbi:hypothetical protein Tco_1502622 [Tanacetum coccineum]